MLRPRPSSTSRFVIFCLELASSSSTLRTASKLTPLTWEHNQCNTIRIKCFYINIQRLKTERVTERVSCDKKISDVSLEPGSVIPAHEGKAQGSQVQDLPGLQSELKGSIATWQDPIS